MNISTNRRLVIIYILLAAVCLLLFLDLVFQENASFWCVSNDDNALIKSKTTNSCHTVHVAFCIPKDFMKSSSAMVKNGLDDSFGGSDSFLEAYYLSMYVAVLKSEGQVKSVDKVDYDNKCLVHVIKNNMWERCLADLNPTQIDEMTDNKRLWKLLEGGDVFNPKGCIAHMPIIPNRLQFQWGYVPVEAFVQRTDFINSGVAAILPIGVSEQLVKKFIQPYRGDRTILFDEIYPMILNQDFPENMRNYAFKTFRIALSICRELSERHNWTIMSFIGRGPFEKLMAIWQEEAPWMQVVDLRPTSYSKYLKLLNNCSFYFSHYFESYGLPFFESSQFGLPILVFSEQAHDLVFQDMQNSVKFSLYSDPVVSAAKIEDYFKNRWNEDTRKRILQDSHTMFSADTFGTRTANFMRSRELIW